MLLEQLLADSAMANGNLSYAVGWAQGTSKCLQEIVKNMKMFSSDKEVLIHLLEKMNDELEFIVANSFDLPLEQIRKELLLRK